MIFEQRRFQSLVRILTYELNKYNFSGSYNLCCTIDLLEFKKNGKELTLKIKQTNYKNQLNSVKKLIKEHLIGFIFLISRNFQQMMSQIRRLYRMSTVVTLGENNLLPLYLSLFQSDFLYSDYSILLYCFIFIVNKLTKIFSFFFFIGFNFLAFRLFPSVWQRTLHICVIYLNLLKNKIKYKEK